MWWGLTPALNLFAEVDQPEINVLCIGQRDCRHVVRTLSKKFKYSKCKLKLYNYEPCIENIARSLLFLSVVLDEEVGVGQRASRYLELYGNTLLRPSTSEYLLESTQRLIKIITDLNFGEKVLPLVCLQNLKYKERDALETIFKYWLRGRDSLDILTYWNCKLRTSLGTRYDARLGVYDWDLHMRYRPYGAEMITIQEYKQFREKGVSFLLDDSDPCVPNVTLASFQPKDTKPMAGYFGDITTGPYPAFGLQSEEKGLLKKINGTYAKTATDISLWNMHQILFEIKHKENFHFSNDGDTHWLTVKQDLSNSLKQRKMGTGKLFDVNSCTFSKVPDIEIIFMPVSSLSTLLKKPQYQDHFNLITIPQDMVSQVPFEMIGALKDKALVVVESSKYNLNLNKDALAQAKTDTDGLFKKLGGEAMFEFDYKKDDYIKYKIVK